MVAPSKRVHASTRVGRIASVFALLIWSAIALSVAGALFVVVTSRFDHLSPMMWAPVFVVALVVVGGLLCSVSLFLRRTR
jgi:hypothetical protein